MIIVNFIGNEVEKYIRGLDQYDKGQILCIRGLDLPKFVEVQFSLQETGGLAERIVGITTDGVTEVEIPNYMLTNNDATSDYEIYAFVYVTNETSGETVYKIIMEVNSRPKPNPYDTPEDIDMFDRAIEVMKDSAEAAENAAGTSEKNAQKTGEDRKAIEEMVGTITGIEQQVQDVKEYAGQAQSASEKALLSEQEAKKSEEASLQHRTGAETAENNAEMAEQNAKKSAQAVEQAKQLVMQMGQQVLQDKNQVAEKVEAFNKVVTDASDAINTKKTESLTEIETAKTDAVNVVGTKGTEQTKKVADEGAKQVKAVTDKGTEVLQSIPQDFTTQMSSKLDRQQGIENKGKALVVGDDGNVTVGEVQGGDGIPIINTMSGASPLVVPDSAERVNKGFGVGGNTTQNQDPPPSPDNLQEIKNVGKWNEVTQKYEVDVILSAKNLFNLNRLKKGFVTSTGNGFKIDENSSYVSSIYLNMIIPLRHGQSLSISGILQDKSRIRVKHNTGNYYNKYTADKDTEIMVCFYAGLTEEDKGKCMIEISGTSTEYEPYKEQTLTITSDRPITKWDKLVEQDGQIGWLYGSYVGRLPKTGYSAAYKSDGQSFYFRQVLKTPAVASKEQYFNIFKCGDKNSFKGVNVAFITIDRNMIEIALTDISIDSSAKFEEYLHGLPDMEVVYQTQEYEFAPLPQSEQDAIRALSTYYPTTVITTDGGEVVPTVELTYTADTKNFILNREKAMQAQMLNIQSALISQKISGGGIKVTDSSGLPVEEFSMSGKTEQAQSTGAQLFDWEPYLTTVGSKEQFKEKLSEGYTVLRGVAVNTSVIQYGMSNQVVMCINVKPDTQYFFGGYKKSNIVFLNDSLDVVGNSAGATFLTTADTAYIVMYIFNYAQGPNFQVYTLSEIEEMNIIGYGSVVKPYEPYTGEKSSPSPDYPQPIEITPQGVITVEFTDGTNHQIVELNCPREFTKWDRLEKVDDVWNWVFGSRKETFENATVKTMIDVSSKNIRQFTVHHETDIKDAWSNAYVLSNNFIGVSGNKSYTQSAPYDFYVAYHNKDIVFSSKKFDGIFETKETFQEWLQSSGVYILHKSDEKELIPLSQSEQDKLNALTMYAPNTEITNTGGCNMELTYTVDTKSYVDAKIAEVSTAVVQKGIENV